MQRSRCKADCGRISFASVRKGLFASHDWIGKQPLICFLQALRVRASLAPYVLGDGLHERDLGPLLLFGKLVAFLGGRETALGGQAQRSSGTYWAASAMRALITSGSSSSGFLK